MVTGRWLWPEDGAGDDSSANTSSIFVFFYLRKVKNKMLIKKTQIGNLFFDDLPKMA